MKKEDAGKIPKMLKADINELIDLKKRNFKKQIFFVLKVLILIFIGFLPSFLFIAFFIQYGSPFGNYINFLANFNSSWIAWVSAIVIVLLGYFIWKAIRSRKKIKNVIKNKFVLIAIIISLLVILVLISAQLYLYVNSVLGNDILVKLSADNDNIFFTNNSMEDINFKISVVMNPFCSAECNYNFFDESSGKEIDTGAFNLTSVTSKTKTYEINSSHLVEGSQSLNRFEVGCTSPKTFLCFTKGEESRRAVLITINYNLTEEDALFKNESKGKIISLGETLVSAANILNYSYNNLNLTNNSFTIDDLLQNYKELYNSSLDLNNSLDNLKNLWEIQNFGMLKEQLPDTENQIQKLANDSEQLNVNISSEISLYNNLTDNMTNSKKILIQLSQNFLTDSICSELNKAIFDFNNATITFNQKNNLSYKQILVQNIFSEVNSTYTEYLANNTGGSFCILLMNITNINFAKINLANQGIINNSITISEPVPICCFLGKCEKCCDKTCSNENYPIIFLHGHSINKALPADYSLDAFSDMKQKFIPEGYIDAGAFVISPVSEQQGLWGKVNSSIMVTGSYFFDVYKTSSGENTVPSKTDNVDTYSIRLKSMIDQIKYRTGKDKVIIIAHSMGGLVTRRYIQVFGGKDIDEAILIDVPNHGIDDKVRDYCAIFGPQEACSDMDKDSIFMNKLNNAPTDIVPMYNIIGIGCNMGNETGDGIVKNSSQFLSYATNYYITGTCNELYFDFLHGEVVNPQAYPETYNIINEILKNSSF